MGLSLALVTCEISQLNSKTSSFKSNENIHKKEDGSYYVVSANKAPPVTPQRVLLAGSQVVFLEDLPFLN